MIELLGIVASIVVIVSFFMNDEIHIRKVNMIGALLYVLYGVAIGSLSVVFLNSFCICLHLYKIIRKGTK